MVVLSYKIIREFGKQHPQFFEGLSHWYKTLKREDWANFHDVKNVYNSVDSVGNDLYVFNLRGNQLRAVVRILFNVRTVYIKFIGTHAEYDKVKLDKL